MGMVSVARLEVSLERATSLVPDRLTFLEALRSLRALAAPQDLLTPDHEIVDRYRELVRMGSRSRFIAPTLQALLLPSSDRDSLLNYESVRKCLLAMEVALDRPFQLPLRECPVVFEPRRLPSLAVYGSLETGQPPVPFNGYSLEDLEGLIHSPQRRQEDFLRRGVAHFLLNKWLSGLRLLKGESEEVQQKVPPSSQELEETLALYTCWWGALECYAQPSGWIEASTEELFKQANDICFVWNWQFQLWEQLLCLYEERYELRLSQDQRDQLVEAPFKALESFLPTPHRKRLRKLATQLRLGDQERLKDRSLRIMGELERRINCEWQCTQIIIQLYQSGDEISYYFPLDYLLRVCSPSLQNGLEVGLPWETIWGDHGRHVQFQYSPIPYHLLRSVVRHLNLSTSDVVYELGSGYGRMALYLGGATAAQVRGVELLYERWLASDQSRAALGLRNVIFLQEDAAIVDLTEGTVFIVFNSFDPDTLQKVGKRLQEEGTRRPIRVVSIGPSNPYFWAQDWLEPILMVSENDIFNPLFGAVIFRSRKVS